MTHKHGASIATVVADTISPEGERITSVEVTYPRFILPELNTHRLLTRSTASSRAVPVKKRLQQVNDDPFVPETFGVNRPGMQAKEILDGKEHKAARDEWIAAARDAVKHADALNKLGVHKQIVNRVLEPFTFVSTIVTATEWENFFVLRDHPDAQPEIRDLARAIKAAMRDSVPVERTVHLPYYAECRWGAAPGKTEAMMRSAARCARVSYKSHKTGEAPSPDEDENLAAKLLAAKHMSPFDHPAIAYSELKGAFGVNECRQYVGWIPFRVIVERQLGISCSTIPLRG